MSGSSRRAELALVALTANWGFTFILVKDALAHSDPLSFVVLRFAVGALALLPFAWRGYRDALSLRRGVVLGIFLFLGFALQTVGLEYTTPARSAFITGLSVVGVPLVELLLFRRRVSLASWLAVAISVGGLYLLNGGLQQRNTWVGDLLTLGCAVAYAFHITLTSHLTPGTRVTTLVCVQLCVVAFGAALLKPFTPIYVSFTPGLVGAILYAGVVCSAFAIGIQSWAQARTSAVRAAVIYTLEPLWALLASAVVLRRETFGPSEFAGGGLLILSVLCAELGGPLWQRFREATFEGAATR